MRRRGKSGKASDWMAKRKCFSSETGGVEKKVNIEGVDLKLITVVIMDDL